MVVPKHKQPRCPENKQNKDSIIKFEEKPDNGTSMYCPGKKIKTIKKRKNLYYRIKLSYPQCEGMFEKSDHK